MHIYVFVYYRYWCIHMYLYTKLRDSVDLKAGLGFVRTNVRVHWNSVHKAFHRIRPCGNDPTVWLYCKRDLDAANLRPSLEQGCGKHTPSVSILIFHKCVMCSQYQNVEESEI